MKSELTYKARKKQIKSYVRQLLRKRNQDLHSTADNHNLLSQQNLFSNSSKSIYSLSKKLSQSMSEISRSRSRIDRRQDKSNRRQIKSRDFIIRKNQRREILNPSQRRQSRGSFQKRRKQNKLSAIQNHGLMVDSSFDTFNHQVADENRRTHFPPLDAQGSNHEGISEDLNRLQEDPSVGIYEDRNGPQIDNSPDGYRASKNIQTDDIMPQETNSRNTFVKQNIQIVEEELNFVPDTRSLSSYNKPQNTEGANQSDPNDRSIMIVDESLTNIDPEDEMRLRSRNYPHQNPEVDETFQCGVYEEELNKAGQTNPNESMMAPRYNQSTSEVDGKEKFQRSSLEERHNHRPLRPSQIEQEEHNDSTHQGGSYLLDIHLQQATSSISRNPLTNRGELEMNEIKLKSHENKDLKRDQNLDKNSLNPIGKEALSHHRAALDLENINNRTIQSLNLAGTHQTSHNLQNGGNQQRRDRFNISPLQGSNSQASSIRVDPKRNMRQNSISKTKSVSVHNHNRQSFANQNPQYHEKDSESDRHFTRSRSELNAILDKFYNIMSDNSKSSVDNSILKDVSFLINFYQDYIKKLKSEISLPRTYQSGCYTVDRAIQTAQELESWNDFKIENKKLRSTISKLESKLDQYRTLNKGLYNTLEELEQFVSSSGDRGRSDAMNKKDRNDDLIDGNFVRNEPSMKMPGEKLWDPTNSSMYRSHTDPEVASDIAMNKGVSQLKDSNLYPINQVEKTHKEKEIKNASLIIERLEQKKNELEAQLIQISRKVIRNSEVSVKKAMNFFLQFKCYHILDYL